MNQSKWSKRSGNTSGGMYGLGLIGALVYYLSTATSFWMGVVGVFKSLLWPAFLIYEVLQYIAA